jgi:hypothetical protein
MSINKFFRQHYPIIIILTIFLLLRLKVTLQFFDLVFDGAIYIGQAKYIYSFGSAGYFEPLRPLVVPIFLGIGWILGYDMVVWGKFIEIIFSLGTLVLTYIIASKLQNRAAGVLAAAVLAITPMFFLYSDKILTGIPSAFFALLSFYFFMNDKFRLAGFFAAVSFMTRFPQGILLAAYFFVFLISFLQAKNRKAICSEFAEFLVPYAIVASIFLIFNAFKYSSADTLAEAMFWPFMHGSFTISTAGLWMYQGQWHYYILGLLKENYILVFSILFIFYYVYDIRYKQEAFNLLVIAPVLMLAYFTQLLHKEIRFALIFVPYLAIMAGIAIARVYDFAKSRSRILVVFWALILLIVLVMRTPIPEMKEYVSPDVSDVCSFINNMNYTGQVILTTPYPLYCLDNKVEMNLYSIPKLLETADENPDWLLVYAPETFVCQPDDNECSDEKSRALRLFKSRYELLYLNNSTELPIYVFKRPSS